ncbi:SDR family NAD(P)-dependent oxidoreductase [Mesorhizobium sp. M0213]|uniref:SDR family NAD(P)-dependent oxidoreductase n=1 Tax=Mesorhizobium sp. M0213 TaxID=2956917 RepID=UPI00333561E8
MRRTAVITGWHWTGFGHCLGVPRLSCCLADLDEAGLSETFELAASAAVRMSQYVLDVTDREAVAAFPKVVKERHPKVHLLVNNAGVALGGTFEQVSDEDFEWLFEVNFWGIVRMTRAFLPLLRESDDARVVNMSSLFGLIAPPGQAAYSASKFAVRVFRRRCSMNLRERPLA